MLRAAWDALANLSAVSNITVDLLGSPVALPASASALRAAKAAGTVARLGPGRLTHEDPALAIRTLTCDIIGSLVDDEAGEVMTYGACLWYRGVPVALVTWEPVPMSPQNDELRAYLDWTAQQSGGEEP